MQSWNLSDIWSALFFLKKLQTYQNDTSIIKEMIWNQILSMKIS